MEVCVLNRIISYLNTENELWLAIEHRLLIFVAIVAAGIIYLLVKTNAKQLLSEVLNDLDIIKDLVLPFIIVALINLVETFLHHASFIHFVAHFILEFIIVWTAYLLIIVFDYARIEKNLKIDAEFWQALPNELQKLNDKLIGIHTDNLRLMFEPEGLKYFHTTVSLYKTKKEQMTTLKFHRILLIHDCMQSNPANTWIPNAIRKWNYLTKLEKQIQLYIQLHHLFDIELHLVTQKRLHDILIKLKSDANTTSAYFGRVDHSISVC